MNTPNPLTLEATIAQSSNAGVDKTERYLDYFTWVGRVLLLATLVISPWLLGAVDPWAQRYVAIGLGFGLAIWWFETALRRSRSQVIPYVFFPVTFGILIALFQLWELPSSLASIFLNRQIEVYGQLGADLQLSPTISMSHEGTRYFIGILTLGIAALVLGCRYFRTRFEITLLLLAMTINGVALTFFGLIQAMTCPADMLYWSIEMVNGGAKFGPYVCRNNAAGYLLICLACSIGLLVILIAKKEDRGPRQIVSREIPFWRQLMFHTMLFLSELNARKIAAILATVFIAVGVISTLSRGGVLAMMIATVVTLLLYGMARRPSFSGFIFLPMVALVFLIAGWVGFADQALERWEGANLESGSGRYEHWQETWPAIADMGLLGSGIGSYDSVHRLYRDTPEMAIFEYGESQFFQTLVEMGWPGLFLLLACWILVFYCGAHALWNGKSPVTIGVGIAGVFLCTAEVIASAFDFGIYQTSNMIGVAAVAGMLSYNAQGLAGRLKQRSWLQYTFPNSFNQVIGLALFACVFVAGLDMHNRAAIDGVRKISPRRFSLNQPDLKTTESLIAQLRPLVKRAPIKRGLNYLAHLYIHRMRLQYYEVLSNEVAVTLDSTPEEERVKIQNDLWKLTSTDYVQANIFALKRESSILAARAFQQRPFIQENLQYAVNALNLSRRNSILQPEVHLQLMKTYAVLGADRLAEQHAKIASQIAPGSTAINSVIATYFLQSSDGEKAAPYVKRYLQLAPQRFKQVLKLLSGNSVRKIDQVAPSVVLEKFLPDNPKLIYEYATQRVPRESETYSNALFTAERLLGDVSPANHELMVLSAKIKLAMGRNEEALAQFNASLVSKPNNVAVQTQIVSLLNDSGRHSEAISRLEELIERDYLNSKRYTRILDSTKKLLNQKRQQQN